MSAAPRWIAGRRIPAPIQLALLLSACMSWHPESTGPVSVITSQKPSLVRITQADGSDLILSDPTVAGDSLYGKPQATLGEEPGPRTGVALRDITAVATRRTDPNKTTFLAAGIAVATFGALCLGADAFGCGEEEVFAALVQLK